LIGIDLIAVCLCSSCEGGEETWGHKTRERRVQKDPECEQPPLNDCKIWWINDEGETDKGIRGRSREQLHKTDNVGEEDRKRRKRNPVKLFLPEERSSVMKKEGGPWALGPLIKLS